MNRKPAPITDLLRGRRAKIVCTLGPASHTPEMIYRLLQVGMDVVRLNFSHGTHEEHARTVEAVRAGTARLERPASILADLSGPKIRTGALESGNPVTLVAGQRFVLTTDEVEGTCERVSTTYQGLTGDVRKGDRILLSDGLIELRALGARGSDLITTVVNGGELGQHKGINLPGVKLRIPSLTSKDRNDLRFALHHGANYIAVSFVRAAADVLAAKAAIRRCGYHTPVIAKLEKPEAIENLDAILKVADGVMVARGDLGVEMSPEQVPVIQKRIILRALEFRIPVITATQMLESMTENPRPTRAEASDVANAIFDGTDAVMLSAETATGKYPVESVAMMDRIVRQAEASIIARARPRPAEFTVAETISEAICHAAEELHMKVLAVFTESGSTARLISKYRPPSPIIAFSPNQETRRRMSLLWGILPRTISRVRHIDELADAAEKRLLEEKLVVPGEVVGIVAGTPLGSPGSTNFLKLHTILRKRA